ncbi:MAG: D-tyrosyl-tRNA(Tyr) deacylase [Bacteroidales bacterium]|nr:D-tyrosyl-tRNA(Tyr) deacylase [Bacteroidales bacterium]
MRIVIQRVSKADLFINSEIYSSIGEGLVVLVGIVSDDNDVDISWLASKILNLRIFNDDDGVMNRSLIDIDGEIMIVSQFTLHAKTKKGNRPSYIDAAPPEISVPIYESFIEEVKCRTNKEVKTGIFGADMKISLVNDGPVTIIIDSKNRE